MATIALTSRPRPREIDLQNFTHTRKVSQKDVDVFKRGIEPLAQADKPSALLCQFPASFKRDDASVEYLTWLALHLPVCEML